MLRFVADENVNNDIVRGLRRRDPTIDVTRVQDELIDGAADPEVIAWAHDQSRIVLTHDGKTSSHYAHQQIRAGGHTAGVFMIHGWLPIGPTIEDLLTAHVTTEMADWVDVVEYLPF